MVACKKKLAASPVRHRIFDLGWVIEIGWDLDQDKFSLKIQDILFKHLAREEFETRELCHEKVVSNFMGKIKYSWFFLIFRNESILIKASYNMMTKKVKVTTGKSELVRKG